MARADRITPLTKKKEYYSDFLFNFKTNPVTGLLARVTNEESVKQSIKSIVLTGLGERPYSPYLGSKIYSLLFEPMGPVTEQMIQHEIMTAIDNHEPRAKVLNVDVRGLEDRNEYTVTVIFEIVNIPEQQFSVNISLKRVR